jgi:NitT/TauT family transport system substrate-binding protein
LQIAKASTVSIAIGHAHGLPFTIIAPSTVAASDKPICGLMVRPDSTIKTGKDCNGKIFVGNSLQDLTQLSTMAWVDKTGGDSRTLKFVELTQSVTIDAITTGRIDGATALNPVLYDAVSTGHVRVVGNPLDAVAPHFCTSAWFTTTGYAAKNPTVVRRFVAGLRDAVRYQYAHPAEMADYLAPFLHDDLDRLRKMPRTTVGLTLDPKDFQPVIDLIVKYGTVPSGFPARDMLTLNP